MRAYKKIIIATAIAVALGLSAAALATCIVNGAIPDVDIHTHEAGDVEYANEEAAFGCTNIPYEWDQCKDECGVWQSVPDDVDILWEATAGSFKDGDNEGSGVIWIAPASAGNVTLTATADDDARWANDTAKDDSVTIEVVECDDSVDYTVGERCETCEWIEADQFFKYCGTPKYVKIVFENFTGCGSLADVTELILIQSTTTSWAVILNDCDSAWWNVYYDFSGERVTAMEVYGDWSCPAFTDYDLPVCYDGQDVDPGPFTNNITTGDCEAPPCGYGGAARVSWDSTIGHTEFINQFPAWQESVYYEVSATCPDGPNRVRHSSKLYLCIESHTSSSSNEPPNETYWVELPS